MVVWFRSIGGVTTERPSQCNNAKRGTHTLARVAPMNNCVIVNVAPMVNGTNACARLLHDVRMMM
jgi:hypothetical protein